MFDLSTFLINDGWNGAIFLIPSILEVYQMYRNSTWKIDRDGLIAIDGIYGRDFCNGSTYAQEVTDYTIMGLSMILLLIFTFLIKRVSFKKLTCHGRPGALLPMGMLDNHDQIIEFTLAFLSVSEDIYTFIFGFKSDFGKQIPIVKFFIKMAVVVALSITSYITFAGLHNRYLIGYLFGATMSACYSYGDISSSITFSNCLSGTKIIPFIFTAVVYSSIDLSLLCIFVYRTIKHIKCNGCQLMKNKSIHYANRHFCDRYVKMLLKKRICNEKENSEQEELTKSSSKLFQCGNLKEKITEKIYKKIPGFSIPPRLIIGITVGSFFAYRIFIDQIYVMTPTIWKFMDLINERYKLTHTNLTSSFQIITSNLSLYKVSDVQNSYMYLTLFYVHLFIGCALTSIVIGFLNSIIQSFLILRNYRLNFQKITQRGFSTIINLERAPKPYSLVLGFVRFSGYQAAHILWGILVIFFSLTVLLYFVIGIFLLPLIYVENSWSRNLIVNYGPVLLASLILNFIQTLIVKKLFVKEKGELMEIDNRRAFIIFCHCLFFLNAMMGVFTCIKRIIVWTFSGILCFCRIDFSSLPDYLHGSDSGYMCYIGFLYTEQYHHNPIVRCFVNVLQGSRTHLESSDYNQVCNYAETNKQLELVPPIELKYRNKWRVAYTLIHNQALAAKRKSVLFRKIA